MNQGCYLSQSTQAKRVGRNYPSLRLSLSLVNQLPGQTPTSHQELPGHQIDDWVVGEWADVMPVIAFESAAHHQRSGPSEP